MLVASLYFLIDGTKGGPLISALLLITTLVALVLIFLPPAWVHFGQRFPAVLRRLRRRQSGAQGRHGATEPSMPVGSTAVSDDAPTSARLAGRLRPSAEDDVSTR